MKTVSEYYGKTKGGSPEQHLYRACLNGNAEEVAALLKTGADPNTVATEHEQIQTSLLGIAADKGYCDILSLLIAAGADVNLRDSSGRTPLHIVSENITSDRSATVRIARELIAAGIDINAVSCINRTALTEAVFADNAELVQLLLEHKMDPLAADKYDITPLSAAINPKVKQSAKHIVQYMISHDLVTKEIVYLFTYHAILSRDKSLLAELARKWDNWADPGRAPNPLYAAVNMNDPDILRFILDLGAGKPEGAFRHTLSMAVSKGNIGVLQILLEAGADPNAEGIVSGGASNLPLITAAEFNDPKMVQMLLDHGADPDLTNSEGELALAKASRLGNDKLISPLLKGGANINAIQRNGWGALHYAAVHGTIGLMTKLLKNGADPDIKDRRGDTPYGIWLRAADQGKRAQYKDKLEEEIRKAQEKTAKKRQETDPGPEL